MAPPVDAYTNRRTPERRAASSMLIVPTTFTSASRRGLLTDTRTSIWAAKWNTIPGRSLRSNPATNSASRISPTARVTPCSIAAAMLASRPVERSSATTTSCPRSRRASTTWEPMKPAPPVTRALTRRSSPLRAVRPPERAGSLLAPTLYPRPARPLAERPNDPHARLVRSHEHRSRPRAPAAGGASRGPGPRGGDDRSPALAHGRAARGLGAPPRGARALRRLAARGQGAGRRRARPETDPVRARL